MIYTPEQLSLIQNGPWIRTFTNRILNPLDLRVEDVVIDDIAHHLACSNRFVGALRTPVSIAQHSVCVSRLLAPNGRDAALYGLLHDASEAYLGDVSKWVKADPSMALYCEAEERAQRVILERFGLSSFDMEVLHGEALERADRLMVRVEGELGFDIPALNPVNPKYGAVTAEEWSSEVQQAVPARLLAEMDWRTSQTMFLLDYRDLTRIR